MGTFQIQKYEMDIVVHGIQKEIILEYLKSLRG